MCCPGRSSPLGATVEESGVNFSVFSRTATGVELLFFDQAEDARPARVVRLDPADNRTYHYWHAFVPGVRPGQVYGYRVEGPSAPERGLRFDSTKVLLDPYGRGVVVPRTYSRGAAQQAGDNAQTAMKSVVVDPSAYDWEGDVPLTPITRRSWPHPRTCPTSRGPRSTTWRDTRSQAIRTRRRGMSATSGGCA